MKIKEIFRSQKLFSFFVIFSLFFTIIFFGDTKIIASNEQASESIEIKSVDPFLDNDLLLADATDNNITELSFLDDNYGTISDLFVLDNKMFLAHGGGGFSVFNIIDLKPQFITSWNLYRCNKIFADNNLVYVINNSGFNVIDISNPANPEWICSWTNTDDMITDIVAHDNYVFLAGINSLIAVNITDRNNPVAYWDTLAFIKDMHYINGNIHTADALGYIRCFGVSNPSSISIGTTLEFVDVSNIYKSENFIYYATENIARVGEVQNRNYFPHLSEFSFNDTSYNIGVRNNHLFVNEGYQLEIFDCTNKTNPEYIYEYNNAEIEMSSFYFYENYAFVYNAFAIEILDISNPRKITSVYFDIFAGVTQKIFLEGNFAFVADYYSLEILNIANPTNPAEVGSYCDLDGGFIIDVFVKNSCIYLLEKDGSNSIIVILSIANLANPVYQGNVSFTGSSVDFYVDDEFAYVA